MDDGTRQFIERMGLLGEADGMPRIAGRIFGFLFLSDGEHTIDEIAEALGVSRASVSTDARRLVQMEVAERRSRPGDRRDYYAISPAAVRHSIEHRIQTLRRFHDLLESARALETPSPAVRARIAAWDEAHRLVVSAFERVLGELDARG